MNDNGKLMTCLIRPKVNSVHSPINGSKRWMHALISALHVVS